MENEELETQDSLTPDENTELEPESVNADDEADMTALKEKLTKAEELAKNQKIRAEKAEAEAKKLKVVQPKEEPELPKKSENLNVSLSDLAAITAAKIHPDDVERVEKFAKDEGLTLKKALDHEELKAILNIRGELRKSAEATNVGGSRKGSSKSTAEEIHEKAMSGQVPESDEDMKKMIEHRFTPKEL